MAKNEPLPEDAPKSKCSRSNVIRASVAVVLVGIVVAVLVDSFTAGRVLKALTNFLQWVEDHPFVGAIAFVGVYILATVAFIPGSILTIGAGFIFTQALGGAAGFAVALLVVLTGATVGACLAFLLGRYVFRDLVESKLVARFPVIRAVDAVLQKQPFKIMALLRLSPIIPFNAFNYAAGITATPFPAYALACAGIIPGTAAFIFIGTAVSDIKSVAEGNAEGDKTASVIRTVILVVGAVATVAAVAFVTILARRELKRAGLDMENQKDAVADAPAEGAAEDAT